MSRRGGKACIGVEAGIDVNLEDRRACLRDRRGNRRGHSRQGRTGPSRTWRASPARPRARARLLQAEAARRADIGLAVARPFGVVADDARAPFAPILEQDLGDRQHAGAATLFKQREVELAPLDEAFREMLGAEARAAVGDDAGSVSALHHRALVEPERAMLPHRLDDDLRIRIEPCAVHREAGRGQAFALQASAWSRPLTVFRARRRNAAPV